MKVPEDNESDFRRQEGYRRLRRGPVGPGPVGGKGTVGDGEWWVSERGGRFTGRGRPSLWGLDRVSLNRLGTRMLRVGTSRYTERGSGGLQRQVGSGNGSSGGKCTESRHGKEWGGER